MEKIYFKILKVVTWLCIIILSFATLFEILFFFNWSHMWYFISGIIFCGLSLEVQDRLH